MSNQLVCSCSGDNLSVVSLVLVNTLVAPSGALAAMAVINWGNYEVDDHANAVLAGLVSVSGCCNIVQPWAAALIGIFSAFTYTGELSLFAAVSHCVSPRLTLEGA